MEPLMKTPRATATLAIAIACLFGSVSAVQAAPQAGGTQHRPVAPDSERLQIDTNLLTPYGGRDQGRLSQAEETRIQEFLSFLFGGNRGGSGKALQVAIQWIVDFGGVSTAPSPTIGHSGYRTASRQSSTLR